MPDQRPAPDQVPDFLDGHTDPKTLPARIIAATPGPMLGYVATAYLAGVQVGDLAGAITLGERLIVDRAVEWRQVADGDDRDAIRRAEHYLTLAVDELDDVEGGDRAP